MLQAESDSVSLDFDAWESEQEAHTQADLREAEEEVEHIQHEQEAELLSEVEAYSDADSQDMEEIKELLEQDNSVSLNLLEGRSDICS